MIIVNDEIIESFGFPGGERNVRVDLRRISERNRISALLYKSDDILELLLVADAIRRQHFNAKIMLTIPYFPYSRQDRVCTEGESLSVSVMAKLINDLNCRSVQIYDPHSIALPLLLKNCFVIEIKDIFSFLNRECVFMKFLNKRCDTIVSPDAGAEKKVLNFMKNCIDEKYNKGFACASKIRNPTTGEITHTDIEGDFAGKNIMIMDDICDGGRTFVELAKVLKEKGASELYLYVTHGIFSNGFNELFKYFHKIFCYHAFPGKHIHDPRFVILRKFHLPPY